MKRVVVARHVWSLINLTFQTRWAVRFCNIRYLPLLLAQHSTCYEPVSIVFSFSFFFFLLLLNTHGKSHVNPISSYQSSESSSIGAIRTLSNFGSAQAKAIGIFIKLSTQTRNCLISLLYCQTNTHGISAKNWKVTTLSTLGR